MFCRDGGDTPEAPAEEASEEDSDPIVIERDAPSRDYPAGGR
jgi:hypothetical protein